MFFVRIDGTDGSAFPPSMVDKKKTLYIYNSIMCRRFPLVFDEEVLVSIKYTCVIETNLNI